MLSTSPEPLGMLRLALGQARRAGRFLRAVPHEVDAGDRHAVAAAFAARADAIVTNNVRHFAAERLAESAGLVQTADEFLVHQWWLDADGVGEVLSALSAATSRPALTVEWVLESLRRVAPEFVTLAKQGAPLDEDPPA